MMKPNAIDVTTIPEDQLLRHLGPASWVIALPEGLPDLTITPQWRHTVQVYAGQEFTRWVIEGIDYVLTHDYDPPWDCSGSLQRVKMDSLLLLTRHDSLSNWAIKEYIGYSRATFMSGMGLAWVTYDEAIQDYGEKQLTELFSVHCINSWGIEQPDLFEDERWDDSDIPIIISMLSYALLADALQLSTAEAWKRFEKDIHAENEAKRKKAEHYQYMQEQVKRFWQLYFPDLMDIRIEMPSFREMGLEKRIAEVLADTDPALVQMMAEVRIPGYYSNSVRERIQDIVRRANL